MNYAEPYAIILNKLNIVYEVIKMQGYIDEVYSLIKQLCKIPAPSNFEDERARFCKDYLESVGFSDVYIDEAKNAVLEYNCSGSDELTVFVAHTDTVFPDKEPMPFYEKDGKAFSPGVGDNTAGVAAMLVASKYLIENNLTPSKGFLFVCNSCEEGLGNLKGVRAVMEKYAKRVKRLISFDSFKLNIINHKCVGSHRYKVKAETAGGHSFGSFGNENAIASLCKIVNEIYKIEVPKFGDSRTTYNVGIISGGTSVNTIAQSAEALCEYRSDNVKCLKIMSEKFAQIFSSAQKDGVKITVEKVGDRPCADGVDENEQNLLINTCSKIIEDITGREIILSSGSTDCNIPLSLGIPAITVGTYDGEGAHTREEFIEIGSLSSGFKIAVEVIKTYLNG